MSVLARLKQHHQKLLPWMVWGVAGCFYFLQYFLRVSVSGMEEALREGLHLTAMNLSNITAAFFYAYVIVQVPGGVLVDHYGSRKLLILSTLLCALGCFFFYLANNVLFLELGRMFIGAGAAFAVVICLTLGRAWFSHKAFVIVNGLTLSVGTLGAVLGGGPFTLLIRHESWRFFILIAALGFIVLAILGYLIVRDKPAEVTYEHKTINWRKTWQGVVEVLKTKTIWIAGFYTGTLFLPIASFACLWGVPFFVVKYHVNVYAAGDAVALMFIGLGCGAPLVGWFSNLIDRYVLVMRYGSIIALILALLILYVGIPFTWIYVLMFLFGLILGTTSLAFVIVREATKGYDSGLAFSLTNVFQLTSGAISLPIIGHILDVTWTGKELHNVHIFTLHNYDKALLIIPISIALSLFFAFFLREPEKLI